MTIGDSLVLIVPFTVFFLYGGWVQYLDFLDRRRDSQNDREKQK